MPAALDRMDDFQRRHPFVGFPLAVVYKFFDDQGNYLAVIVSYYAFVAIFPMLLIASSVLGFVLQGDPELQQTVLESALSKFPIVGTELGRPGGIQGSVQAVVLGSLAALYGILGLAQAAQNAVNVAWAVPRNSRFNPIVARLRSFLLLLLGGLTVLGLAVLSSITSHLDVFGPDLGDVVQTVVTLVSVLVNAIVLSSVMNLATSRRVPFSTALPGGIAVAVMWQLLQVLGGYYVSRVIARASDMSGVFAVVLGLLALIYLASVMAIIGLELNVVLANRLYPRALLTPFTDGVQLTDADRRVYTDYAKAQRHKGFERVLVTFGTHPSDGSKK